MALATGNALGKEILEALGLPWKNVTGIDIQLRADGAAHLRTDSFITNEEGQRIGQRLALYRLVEISEEEMLYPVAED